jgi:hypothetical protein
MYCSKALPDPAASSTSAFRVTSAHKIPQDALLNPKSKFKLVIVAAQLHEEDVAAQDTVLHILEVGKQDALITTV